MNGFNYLGAVPSGSATMLTTSLFAVPGMDLGKVHLGVTTLTIATSLIYSIRHRIVDSLVPGLTEQNRTKFSQTTCGADS